MIEFLLSFEFSEFILDLPIIVIPIPIRRSEKIKLSLNGLLRKIRESMNVNSGKVIEIARAMVVPSFFEQ